MADLVRVVARAAGLLALPAGTHPERNQGRVKTGFSAVIHAYTRDPMWTLAINYTNIHIITIILLHNALLNILNTYYIV
jgi:hypothetical protein